MRREACGPRDFPAGRRLFLADRSVPAADWRDLPPGVAPRRPASLPVVFPPALAFRGTRGFCRAADHDASGGRLGFFLAARGAATALFLGLPGHGIAAFRHKTCSITERAAGHNGRLDARAWTPTDGLERPPGIFPPTRATHLAAGLVEIARTAADNLWAQVGIGIGIVQWPLPPVAVRPCRDHRRYRGTTGNRRRL